MHLKRGLSRWHLQNADQQAVRRLAKWLGMVRWEYMPIKHVIVWIERQEAKHAMA